MRYQCAHMSVYEFQFNGHSMQYKVKMCIYLVLHCSSVTIKLSKRMFETESALSYYTDFFLSATFQTHFI